MIHLTPRAFALGVRMTVVMGSNNACYNIGEIRNYMSARIIGSNFSEGSILIDFCIYGGLNTAIKVRGASGGIKIYEKDRTIYVVYPVGVSATTMLISPNSPFRANLPSDAVELSVNPY